MIMYCKNAAGDNDVLSNGKRGHPCEKSGDE